MEKGGEMTETKKVDGLKEIESHVYTGYFETATKQTQAYGILAIAQQLSRIATSLESIDGHLADLLTEYRDRDWKGVS